MSKRKKIDKKRSVKQKPITLSGHVLFKKSGHLITSRPYGSPGRYVILFCAVFFLLMILTSVSVLYTTPLNPAVWATLVFFTGLLLLLLIYENNVFPVLCKEKLIWALCAWFIVFFITPYMIMNISYFSFPLFLLTIIFVLALVPIIARIAVPENRWIEIKHKTKDKILHPRSKQKAKKPVKRISDGLTGTNKKRKIYRR